MLPWRRCYGKMWGLMRKVCCAVTQDYGAVQDMEYEELMGTLQSTLKALQHRQRLAAATDDRERELLDKVEEVRCTQDPPTSKQPKARNCRHCRALAAKGKLPSAPQRAHDKRNCPYKHLLIEDTQLEAPRSSSTGAQGPREA